MITILEAKRAGLFGKGKIAPNIIAGVIVGVVALPLAMAFAIASGARPEHGLYTAIIGGFMVSALGGSRVQIAGPTGAFIAILAAVTAKYGIDGLQLATLMAGCILFLMGAARLGGIIKFIPSPVIVGFTAGIAVIIFVGQWRYFLGLPAVTGEHFHEQLLNLIEGLPQFHSTTTALAVMSLLLVVYGGRIKGLNRIPGPLLAMVAATLVQALFQFQGVATIGSAFGGIPQALPSFALPEITPSRVIELMGPAFTIALLGAIESLLSAVVADGMSGTHHDSNQELIGQGLANIVTPLFGGFAATGAIARTATNIRNGGTSPLAGITHTLTLVAILVFLAPLAEHIPLAALAAILFVVAWNLSEVKHVAHIIRCAPRADIAILLMTLLLTVFVDLVVAVNIGVILATLQFIRRMRGAVRVNALDENALNTDVGLAERIFLPKGVLVYEIDGPFFFGAVEHFEEALRHTHTEPGVLILRFRRVPFIDMTGIQALEAAIVRLEKNGVRVMLCETNQRVHGKLWKAGVLKLIEEQESAQSLRATLTRAERVISQFDCEPDALAKNRQLLLETSRQYFRKFKDY